MTRYTVQRGEPDGQLQMLGLESQSLGDTTVFPSPPSITVAAQDRFHHQSRAGVTAQAPELQLEATDCRAKPGFLAICPLLGAGGSRPDIIIGWHGGEGFSPRALFSRSTDLETPASPLTPGGMSLTSAPIPLICTPEPQLAPPAIVTQPQYN